MNVAVIGLSDRRLRQWGARGNAALHVEMFETADRLLADAAGRHIDAAVVCGGFLKLADFCDAAERVKACWPKAKLAVWPERGDPLLDRREALLRYCASQGLQVWEPDEDKEPWDVLLERLNGKTNGSGHNLRGHLAVFQGLTPNIGTTVLSFGSAVQLARETGSNVAYVCLNLKSSKLHHYVGVDHPGVTLDGIRAELKSGTLQAGSLMNRFHRFPDLPRLSVLFGNMLREQAEFYAVEDIALLLDLCRELFDITVAEVSAYWDNAAVFAAMLEADTRIFACANRLGSFQEDYRRWCVPMLDALKIDRNACNLVVTQTRPLSGYSLSDIRKQTGLNIVGTIRHHPAVEAAADQGRLHELLAGSHPVGKDLQGIARMLSMEGKLAWGTGNGRTLRARYRKLLPLTGR